MKKLIYYSLMLLAFLNCKQKPETVQKVPDFLRTDLNQDLETKNENDETSEEIEVVESTEQIEDEEIEEVTEELEQEKKVYDNEILLGIDAIDPWDYRHIPITKQNEVDAIMAFQMHSSNPETNCYLYAISSQDIDGDGINEMFMEYTTMSSDSGANWAGQSFMALKIINGELAPIIDKNIGSKGTRHIRFQEVVNSNEFMFKVLSTGDPQSPWNYHPDAKVDDIVVFRYESGNFNELKD